MFQKLPTVKWFVHSIVQEIASRLKKEKTPWISCLLFNKFGN